MHASSQSRNAFWRTPPNAAPAMQRLARAIACLYGAILAGLAAQNVVSAIVAFQPLAVQRLVFANYLVSFTTYGDTVADYKREIQEAQALGIDGFTLDVAAWSDPNYAYYQTRTANMFEAAKQLGTGFRLMFMADMCCGLSEADIQSMMKAYQQHPRYFVYKGGAVLTTFAGQEHGEAFWRNTLKPLRGIVFVPNFGPMSGEFLDISNPDWNGPAYTQISSAYSSSWRTVTDGLAYFSLGAMPGTLASSGEAFTRVMRENGKLYLAGMSPYFWEGRVNPTGQPNLPRRYYEYHGGEGIATQWASIINVQKPRWVQIITWNDFTESYMTPSDPGQMPWKQHFFNAGPLMKSHAGYAEFLKHYIQWFKTGVQPLIAKDALFYFYRTHPKDLSAPNDTQNLVLYGPGWENGRIASTTIPTYGEVLDDIYLTTRLTAPATLTVTSGGVVSTYELPAGIVNTRVPFHPGAQSFDISRNAVLIIHKDGDPIDASIEKYNFTTASGYGYAN